METVETKAKEDDLDRIRRKIDGPFNFALRSFVSYLADVQVEVEKQAQQVAGLTVLAGKQDNRHEVLRADIRERFDRVDRYITARFMALEARVGALEGGRSTEPPDGLDPSARGVMAALDAADDLARSVESVLAYQRANPDLRLPEPLLLVARKRLDAYRRAAAQAVQ